MKDACNEPTWTDLAVWRYGVISPLLHPDPQGGRLCETLESLAQKPYRRPDGSFVRLSPETIRKWLYRYQHGGLPALAPVSRKDKGRSQVKEELIDAMAALRKDHPRWTLKLIFEELITTKQWNGSRPSRASLYRVAKQVNLMRDPHRENPPTRPFAYAHFGQMWSGDFLHGPRVYVGKKKRKTYLHAIIDDATRTIVCARFALSERTETLIAELQTAIRRFGICQRLYVDNGAAYQSRHLKVVCARLGIQLHHTPPYKPQGRGKIERFFRRVREQFLAKTCAKTLPSLNAEFVSWLASYNTTPHRALGISPLEKRMQQESCCCELPETTDLDALFFHEKRCRVYRDHTIRLMRRVFEVQDALPGSRVTVRFLPWEPDRAYVGECATPLRLVDSLENARRFDHPIASTPKGEKYDS